MSTRTRWWISWQSFSNPSGEWSLVFKPQGLADLDALLLVQAEDDVEVLLEGGDQLQGAQDVRLGPLLRVGEVNEQLAARALHAGADLLQHGGPDVAHVGEHGPVDEADEVGAAELGGELLLAEPGLDVLPVHLLQRLVLAEHDLAVLELQRVGVAGLGDGMHLRPLGEVGEDRVEVRIAEDAQVSHLQAEAGEGVGHDGAIAAQLVELADQFDVRAPAGGPGQALGELGDRRQAQVLVGALALVHHMEDVIDEAVQANKGGHLAGAAQPRRAVLRQLAHAIHVVRIWSY